MTQGLAITWILTKLPWFATFNSTHSFIPSQQGDLVTILLPGPWLGFKKSLFLWVKLFVQNLTSNMWSRLSAPTGVTRFTYICCFNFGKVRLLWTSLKFIKFCKLQFIRHHQNCLMMHELCSWGPLKTYDNKTGIQGRSQPLYTPCVMASSSVGLKLGVFGFLPTTHAETNAKQMPPQSLCTVQHFSHVYLHTQTAVDTDTQKTPNLSPMLG